MANSVKAPGVYVDELDTLSFSIGSAATAVPVFAVGASTSTPSWWSDEVGPRKLNSFNDFYKLVTGTTTASIRGKPARSINAAASLSAMWRTTSTRGQGPAHRPLMSNAVIENASAIQETGVPWNQVFTPSLKAYFDNGGGYCYLCPYDKLDFILGLTDVTLIVQCGKAEATADILRLCQPGSGLFALLDGPEDEDVFDKTAFDKAYNAMVASDCAAVYYPWLKANWTMTDTSGEPFSNIHLIAPSAVAAGLICRTDTQRGVWKAPASVAVSAGLTPAVKIGDATQALYTSSDKTKISVNMIRSFPGRGTLIWGARTLTTSGSNWAYINVRRTFDMAERDISVALESVLFEPNGPAIWEAVRAAIDNYLFNLWKKGALYGETPQGGYFIALGEGITMTAADIAEGILKVRVGLAVVRPAEFVILEFTQNVASGD